MSEINVGDVVKLKSGGPEMTVEVVRENSVVCRWFPSVDHGSGTMFERQPEQGSFPFESLKKTGGTVTIDYNAPVPDEGQRRRVAGLPERKDLRPKRVLAIGMTLTDANAVIGRGETTHFAVPGDPCTGEPFDAIAYGPRFKAVLDWYEHVVLTRVKSDAEGAIR